LNARHQRRVIDGALLTSLRIPFGYWEAKDTNDDLDAEIRKKIRDGYPTRNTIFEDTQTAVLYQYDVEAQRAPIHNTDALYVLLNTFFSYEREEIAQFHRASAQFQNDLPSVISTLREVIDSAYEDNSEFRQQSNTFLAFAQRTINPHVSEADIREMLIQHILTEDIFSVVFRENRFHTENNIAQQLFALERTFLTRGVRRDLLQQLEPYYAAVHSAASLIDNHKEKQGFLKTVYENFYRIYNPKAADRLGVIYTPEEIVSFMIRAADWVFEQHYGTSIADPGVQILDPAAGTGTYVVELLEYLRGQPDVLESKYHNELFANEVAILPYYVANLNIEATYATIKQSYQEFQNLCFVDTLDNISPLRDIRHTTSDLFGAFSDENIERISRQNSRPLRLIIGNPPYYANQKSENEQNQSRDYPEVDRRIRATYVAESEAQKTKMYDMFVRFFRWASDRVPDGGVVCFITNRAYIDKFTYDGFRKCVRDDFTHAYIVDLGGDYRDTGAAGGGNVFGISIGVAIGIWVKRNDGDNSPFEVSYVSLPDLSGAEKLAWLNTAQPYEIEWQKLRVMNEKHWTQHPIKQFENAVPIADKKTRDAQVVGQERAVFKSYTLGISTNRDEWVYSWSPELLRTKMEVFLGEYNALPHDTENFPNTIKWSETLKRKLARNHREQFDEECVRAVNYRPFTKRWMYKSSLVIDRPGGADLFFDPERQNPTIVFTDPTGQKPWFAFATNGLTDLHYVGAGAGAVCLPLWRYQGGETLENITDWALQCFRSAYENPDITKVAIFEYIYGVLCNPLYAELFKRNLRRGLPQVPFYSDFDQWRAWGRRLLNLHINYEIADRAPVGVQRSQETQNTSEITPILKSEPENGRVIIDADTVVNGIPPSAWNINLGSRSALDWLLNGYKSGGGRDSSLPARFRIFNFGDYRETLIDRIARVVTVTTETQEILQQMRDRGEA
jgi:predicted helicase